MITCYPRMAVAEPGVGIGSLPEWPFFPIVGRRETTRSEALNLPIAKAAIS